MAGVFHETGNLIFWSLLALLSNTATVHETQFRLDTLHLTVQWPYKICNSKSTIPLNKSPITTCIDEGNHKIIRNVLPVTIYITEEPCSSSAALASVSSRWTRTCEDSHIFFRLTEALIMESFICKFSIWKCLGDIWGSRFCLRVFLCNDE